MVPLPRKITLARDVVPLPRKRTRTRYTIPDTRQSLMAGGPSPTQISDRGLYHDKIHTIPTSQHMKREHICRATSKFKGARNIASRAALPPSLKISQGPRVNPDPLHEGLATERAAAPNTHESPWESKSLPQPPGKSSFPDALVSP